MQSAWETHHTLSRRSHSTCHTLQNWEGCEERAERSKGHSVGQSGAGLQEHGRHGDSMSKGLEVAVSLDV